MLVKKLFGNDLVGRSVKYLIKCPYYEASATAETDTQIVAYRKKKA